MEKTSNKTVDYRVYVTENGKNTKILNTTEITLPSIEKLTDTIKGSGIAGEIDFPTLGQIGSMETEVSTRTSDENYGKLANASKLEYRWVTDVYDPSTGKVSTNAHKAFLTVVNKKVDEGKLSPGEAQDGKLTYEVLSYKRTINGKEIINIDKLNGIVSINGVNLLADIEKDL